MNDFPDDFTADFVANYLVEKEELRKNLTSRIYTSLLETGSACYLLSDAELKHATMLSTLTTLLTNKGFYSRLETVQEGTYAKVDVPAEVLDKAKQAKVATSA